MRLVKLYYALPLLFGLLLFTPTETKAQENPEELPAVQHEEFPEDDKQAAVYYYSNYVFKPKKRSPIMWIVGFAGLGVMAVFLYFRIRQQRKERENI